MAETADPVIRLAAYFGAVGGGAPDYGQPPTEEWSVDRIDESDPRRPVAYLTRALETYAVDRTSLFSTREVHIWACDSSIAVDDDDYRIAPLFWGEATSNRTRITAGELETAVCKLHRFHFGEPLEGETVFDPVADPDDVIVAHRTARFNPTIDGKIAANMAIRHEGVVGLPTTHNLWIDPESVRTEEAAAVHYQNINDPFSNLNVSEWDLGLAVETLQRVLNADEDHIKNVEIYADPDVPEPPFDNAETPQNVTLKRGMYLDECLDKLLPQYGCSWFVTMTVDSSGGHAARFIQPELAYYQRGVGTEKDLKLQAPGSALDADLTNCLEADIEFDIGGCINKVIAHGHPVEREVTIELVRAWEESDDSTTAEQLVRGGTNSQFAAKPHVHRKWVANEAGDYNGLRADITAELDLSSVFPDGYVVRRRTIDPPLTYRNLSPTETDGIRGPVLVEFSLDGGTNWYDVTGLAPLGANARFIVLPNEIGIYFNQPTPPPILVDNNDVLKLRITGTLTSDRCLTKTADVPTWAPNQEPIPLLVDVGDRFFDRARQATGPHTSGLSGDHDSRDDGDALQTFADAMRDQEAAANVSARITISGITTDYAIGDLLTGISGRNIDFNRSGDELNPLYVQIVGRVFNGDNQTTTLIVQPYDIPRGQA